MSARCRVVDRWSWVRLLRQGPRDKDFRLAMLTLQPFMDEDSTTYVTIATWAREACMGSNTLQKARTTALDTGWLFAERRREGKNHKSLLLRCTAPYDVVLSDKDEELMDALVKRFRDIDESVSAFPGDTANKAVAVTALGDTANDHAVTALGDTANDHAVTALGDTANGNPTVLAASGDTASVTQRALQLAVTDEHQNEPMLYPKSPETDPCYNYAITEKSPNPLATLEMQKEGLEVVREVSKRKTEGRAASDTSRMPRYKVDKVEADRLDRIDLANHFALVHRNWPLLQVALRFSVHIDDLKEIP